MAVTVTKSPRNINTVNSPLVYSVSSSNYGQPQFRYVTDIYYSGSTAGSDRLSRLFHAPNIHGTANIDVSPILSDYISYDYDWKIYYATQSREASKKFTIKFGEEYGTSVSSSRTIYTGSVDNNINTLNANIQYPSFYPVTSSFTGSIPTDILTASLDQEIQRPSYENFYYEPFFVTGSGGQNTFWNRYGAKILSNDPMQNDGGFNLQYVPETNRFFGGFSGSSDATSGGGVKPIGTNDWETVTMMQGVSPQGTFLGPTQVTFTATKDENIILNFTHTFGVQTGSVEGDAITLNLGVGIPNLLSASAVISGSDQWDFYDIAINTPQGTLSYNQTFYNEDKDPREINDSNGDPLLGDAENLNNRMGYYPRNCGDKTRFAFINSYGTWEYISIYNPTRRITEIKRETYEKPFVKTQQEQYTYSINNRGETQYYAVYNDTFDITTDQLDRAYSNLYQEMFNSSEVYIQSEIFGTNNFIPINILNTSERVITDTYRDRFVTYDIRYQYANNREPR